jgi:hypothetical protein
MAIEALVTMGKGVLAYAVDTVETDWYVYLATSKFPLTDIFRIRVDDEIVKVVSVESLGGGHPLSLGSDPLGGSSSVDALTLHLTVVRATDGTRAETHVSGATCRSVTTGEGLVNAVTDLADVGYMVCTLSTIPKHPVVNKGVFLTDAPYMLVHNGSEWEWYGPIHLFQLPLYSTFTPYNIGAAHETGQSGTYILTDCPSSTNLRMMGQPIPASPFTVTMACHVNVFGNGTALAGMVVRASGTTQFTTFGVVGGSSLRIGRMASVSAFTSWVYNEAIELNNTMIWLRYSQDATNQLFSVSLDGVNFRLLLTESKAVYGTVTHIGYCVASDTFVYDTRPSISVYSWVTT